MTPPALGRFSPTPCAVLHRQWAEVAVARLQADPCPGQDPNRWVNRTVAYAPDAGADLWQAPAETLSRKAGDCEDLALLKRAILALRGTDSFLLIGRDLVQRGGHACLLVGDRVWDNLTDDPLDVAALLTVFTPLIAYGTAGAWAYSPETA